MVLSADKVTRIDDSITFYVFSENPNSVEVFQGQLRNVKVRAFEIPAYKWPEATLLRYQIFHSQISEMNNDLLMHLDADMLVVSNPWDRVKNQTKINSIVLVEHPGFWRPSGLEKLFLYLKHPSLSYRDMRLSLKRGGIGAWEENNRSSAYVPRISRKKYFCGGTWFGGREAIGELVGSLALSVQSDLRKNIIATWHDESHINKWSTVNIHGVENPELCFDGTYPQIKKLKPSIIAVRKIEKTR